MVIGILAADGEMIFAPPPDAPRAYAEGDCFIVRGGSAGGALGLSGVRGRSRVTRVPSGALGVFQRVLPDRITVGFGQRTHARRMDSDLPGQVLTRTTHDGEPVTRISSTMPLLADSQG